MKVAATYLDNTVITRRKARVRISNKKQSEAMPQWFIFTIIALIATMICLAINIRAYSETLGETQINTQLNSEIEQLNYENALLQKELESLKTDKASIEREAKKLGFIWRN